MCCEPINGILVYDSAESTAFWAPKNRVLQAYAGQENKMMLKLSFNLV